jgi:hypothetical protein
MLLSVKTILHGIDATMPIDEIDAFYKLVLAQYGKVTRDHVAAWFKQ